MRGLWSRFAALCWVVSLVGCNNPERELGSVRYGPTEDRFFSDTYTVANINITYKNEHGEEYTETSESGKYGEGYIGSSRGVAVHVRAKGAGGETDHTGCTWPLLSAAAPNDPLPFEPWVAVIRRGSCNFEIKVQNALRANATAVLIYNDRDTTLLEKMKLPTDNGRIISAVFTYKWKGEEIARLVNNGTRVMIAILKGRTFTHVSNNINKTSVLFVSISFIVLMVISLACLVFYYIQRSDNKRRAVAQTKHNTRLVEGTSLFNGGLRDFTPCSTPSAPSAPSTPSAPSAPSAPYAPYAPYAPSAPSAPPNW